MKKNKILIMTPFLIQGGVEHSLITALGHIDYSENDVTLYLYKEGDALLQDVPPQVHVIWDIDKTHYHRKPYTAWLHLVQIWQRLLRKDQSARKTADKMNAYIRHCKLTYPYRKHFRKTEFDVLISYSLHFCTEAALYIPAKKRYVFLHTSHPDYHADIFETCMQRYTGAVAVCQGVKDVYSRQYPAWADKIDILENYVDAIEIRDKALCEANDVKHEDNITAICSCGRLSREKGYDMAVLAAQILKQDGYRFVWYFVGDGVCRPELERYIREHGLEDSITVTGFLKNPYRYISQADILVQPSYEEAQPLTLIEARKLGTPIVSTRTVGGVGILKNGAYGILTDFTPESLADGIRQMMDNPDLRMHFSHTFSEKDEDNERKVYEEKWRQLLSSGRYESYGQ